MSELVKSNDYGNLHYEFFENIYSKNTRISYKTDISQFYAFLRSNFPELKGPLEVTSVHLIDYRKKMQSLGYSTKSIVRKLASVSHFYKFLIEKNLMTHNPAQSIQRPSANANNPHEGLDDNEAERFLEELDKLPLKPEIAAIYLLFATGLRREEVSSIRLRDFSTFQGKKILTVVGKGGKRVEKLILDWIWDKVEICINELKSKGVEVSDDSFVFQDKFNGVYSKINSKKIYRKIKEITLKAGITKNISTHSMRVTYISSALENNIPIHKIQEDVGHSDIKTTLAYNRRRKATLDSPATSISFLKRSG